MGVLKKGGETRNRGGLDLAQICANATHLSKKKSGEETLLRHAVSRLWHPFNTSKVAGLHLIDTRI